MSSHPSEGQVAQIPDDIAALGAWAIAPILFDDPEFRAIYNTEYEARLADNEAAREADVIREKVRTMIDGALRGIGVLRESDLNLPLFEEESLDSREGIGRFLLELLKENPRIYAKYFGQILECGMSLNSRPPVKKPKKCRWGVEIPADLK